MGGKNPLKEIGSIVTDIVANPVREVARAVGADGVVDGINKVKDFSNGGRDWLIDKGSGKDKRMKKDAENENNRIVGINAANAKTAEKKRAVAAETAIEEKRMAGDSASRTLLTGGTGLDDEEDSVSRRTLKGY
jgi:hypothetical protein